MLSREEGLALSEQLKRPQTRETIQTLLTRALPQLLSVMEVDFLFEPFSSIEETVQKLLSVSSQLFHYQSISRAESSLSLSEGPIKDGITHNFPHLVWIQPYQENTTGE